MADATYATCPTPGARHELAQVAEVAAMLGTPLMPWQRQVVRVATERTAAGGWRYPIVVVTVPRQSGKTTVMDAVLVQRAITRPRLLAFYTAQTGKDAAARWGDLVKAVEASPLRGVVGLRRAAGSQALTFPNGSSVSPFAPTPKSLHGYTPPLVMVDEAFAFDDGQGVALEGAIRPAQITLADRQWWIVSTAGSAESTWLRRWVDLGRQSVTDPAAQVAFFEWSAPEGMDAYDPATWRLFHPALGHTITEENLAGDAASTPPGEWERAYCNRWTVTRDSILPLETWDALAREILEPPRGTIGLGYDIAADRSEAALVAAWIDQDGRAVAKIIHTGPGVDWLPAKITEARAVLGHRAILCAPDAGPARQVTDALARDHVEVHTVPSRDYATACGALLWRAHNGLLRHDGSASLRASIVVAQTRPMGDGAYGWSRDHSPGSIAALVALTIAVRVCDHQPAIEKPFFQWAS